MDRDESTPIGLWDRWFRDSDRFRDRLRTKTLVWAGMTIVVLVIAFTAVVVGIEVGTGSPLRPAHLPSGHAGPEDALWHLATGFVLTIPVRHRRVQVLGTVLALAIDVDHLFGSVLPTVDLRTSHNVFLIALVALALTVRFGRPIGWVAAGGLIVHIAVDGGTFPLVGPFSTATWSLDLPQQVGLIVLAGLLYFGSVHSFDELAKDRRWVWWIVAVGLLASVVALLWPALQIFNQT